MTRTVIEHVLSRLRDIGITDIFGVPGDFAFPVNDAICHHPDIRWVGCDGSAAPTSSTPATQPTGMPGSGASARHCHVNLCLAG
jgi:hypothetical protein